VHKETKEKTNRTTPTTIIPVLEAPIEYCFGFLVEFSTGVDFVVGLSTKVTEIYPCPVLDAVLKLQFVAVGGQ
jgi:hypothetical protein